MVFVLSKEGSALMPTQRQGWVRRALQEGRAIVVKRQPFTIQLTFDTTSETQDVTLGVDAGYAEVGFSAVTDRKELFGGELTLLTGMSERITARRKYRRTRRNRLRHRKPGFLKDTKQTGWLAPSIQHKLDSHTRLINWIKSFLPITRTVIEVGAFDVHKLKNPDVSGTDYQNGEQVGFDNVREYVLHRDHHRCQHPSCKGKSPILQVHHLGFWKQDRSDRPGNLITLCTLCHTANNHQPGGLLFGWAPKIPPFRAPTFMTMVRWKMIEQTGVESTFGYITKARRRDVGLEKSHHNDAFVIAGGQQQARFATVKLEQIKRNNRSLATFFDAKYRDARDGMIRSGKDLSGGRRCRNKNLNTENLRVFRGHKVKKGSTRLRTQRHAFQSGDLVTYQKKVYRSRGVQNKGAYIRLLNEPKDLVVRINAVAPCRYRKGLCVAL